MPQTSCCQLADSVLLALVRLCAVITHAGESRSSEASIRGGSMAPGGGGGEGDHPP